LRALRIAARQLANLFPQFADIFGQIRIRNLPSELLEDDPSRVDSHRQFSAIIPSRQGEYRHSIGSRSRKQPDCPFDGLPSKMSYPVLELRQEQTTLDRLVTDTCGRTSFCLSFAQRQGSSNQVVGII
jgi:hypothetical protein